MVDHYRMSASLAVLAVWLVTMPLGFYLALAVLPPYLRRRAAKAAERTTAAIVDFPAAQLVKPGRPVAGGRRATSR